MYVVHLVVKKYGDVLSASCTCVAGKGETCSHIAALMFYYRENSNSKLQLIQDNDKKTKFYTGLPSFAVFMALFTFLKPKIESMSMWTGKSDTNPVQDECNRGRKC